MNVLVDTSVWSLALRRKMQDLNAEERLLVEELRELIRDGRARLIGLIRQELLSGIKTMPQFDKLRETLQAFPDEPVNTGDYEAAAKAGNECRSSGVATSTVDVLMCAVAMQRGFLIFTTDPDFRNYGKVLPLQFHAIARKG